MDATPIDNLDEIVRRIAQEFNPERIILFGSHATGQADVDSDFDILVVMPVEGSLRSKTNEIDLALANRSVSLDLIVVTPEQFERRKHVVGSVIHETAQEGITVYERTVRKPD